MHSLALCVVPWCTGLVMYQTMACLILVQYDELTVFQDEFHVFVSAATVSCYACCRAEHSKQNAGGVLARCWRAAG